jgi:hypothetical protein
MHNELITQKKKIHEIADIPLKEPSCYKNPNFLFIYLLQKQHHAIRGQEKNLILAWKSMSNTWHKHQWLSEGTQTCYHLEVW